MKIARLVPAFLGVIAAAIIFATVGRFRWALNFDEAEYFQKAWWVARGMAEGHLAPINAVLRHSAIHPFVYGFFAAPALLVGGFVPAAAAAMAALAFGLCVWLAAQSAQGLAPARAELAGLFAALFALGSRLHVEFAGTLMLEVPGAFLSVACLWAYQRHCRAKKSTAWRVGIILAATFFTKYNYGLFLLPSLAAGQAWRRRIRPWSDENVSLLAPLCVISLGWFANPQNRAGIFEFAVNRDSGLGLVDGLTYYLRTFPDVYAANFAAALLLCVGVVASLATYGLRASTFRSNDSDSSRIEGVAPFFAWATHGLLGLGVMSLHPFKSGRFVATFVPSLWVLGGIGLAIIAERLACRAGGRRVQFVGAALAASFVVALTWGIPRLYAVDVPALATDTRPVWASSNMPDSDASAAAAYVTSLARPGRTLRLVGDFDFVTAGWVECIVRTRMAGAAIATGWTPGDVRPMPAAVGPVDLVLLDLPVGSRSRDQFYEGSVGQHVALARAFGLGSVRVPDEVRVFSSAGVKVELYRNFRGDRSAH